MTPGPGERRKLFVGDSIRFSLQDTQGRGPVKGWRALLRTNLGRAEQLRREILQAHSQGPARAGASWRDIPMIESAAGWELELPLAETGYFKAKAYLLDPRGWQHWPQGPDFGVAVHPDHARTGNTVYCAFPRMFGPGKNAAVAPEEKLASDVRALDDRGFTVIPPSGKLRDLTKELPHIFDTLGCRILHLLPVNPTPTTYARFGRFGSPYAALDLTGIDPALVVFDRRTTGVDQFCELTYEAHRRGGRVFLDMVINHTGWGSLLQENHPEWFLRHSDGTFASPGAWGVTWEDLVELKHQNVALWDELADVFLTWCRRGVDGFRCDAGYKVPVPAWQYIVARVQQLYPNTVFLLEGLGGAWDATEALLTEGGMQWAYSELFQNYSGQQVSSYLDHSLEQSRRVGLLVHYSETHDNERLAARGRRWALMRNRLCALSSASGGFGFTCGVEWLATEKILVHGSTGMKWGNRDNLINDLSRLNRLLQEHPCFFDGARLTRLSPADSLVYALLRQSEEGNDAVLVVVNTDVERAHKLVLRPTVEPKQDGLGLLNQLESWVELLGQARPELECSGGACTLKVPAGAAFCLSPALVPKGLAGATYREARARAAWAVAVLNGCLPAENIGPFDWQTLGAQVEESPDNFLAKAARLDPNNPHTDLANALRQLDSKPAYDRLVRWSLVDRHRVTLVPPAHWLLVEDNAPFRATLRFGEKTPALNVESIPVRAGHVACFPPRESAVDAELLVECYGGENAHVQAAIRYLGPRPSAVTGPVQATDLILLTNGRGAMARICVDLGRVLSKYDCVLAANLHPTVPVDRHVLAKRIRAWVNADGFISPLDFKCLDSFEAGPPATWNFVANAGDGRTVEIRMTAEMLPGRNTTVFRFSRPSAAKATGKQLPAKADVRLTVRLDIEDRNFHWETHRNGGSEHHFATHTRALPVPEDRARQIAAAQPPDGPDRFTGFAFSPAVDRQLRVYADAGSYHPQPEWSENIPHPVEQSRGQVPAGDGYSPGWFELPLPKGAAVNLTITAELSHNEAPTVVPPKPASEAGRAVRTEALEEDSFAQQLHRAIQAFVVQRGTGKTVIAGYPWFLDWGRDTFICARGLIAAEKLDEVRQIVLTFARFEKDGTLPNTVFGEDASNRDTSDAPLWFGLVCEELAEAMAVRQSTSARLGSAGALSARSTLSDKPGEGAIIVDVPPAQIVNVSPAPEHTSTAAISVQRANEAVPGEKPAAADVYVTRVGDASGRTLFDILTSIARNYIRGTPNGIRMDPDSGLIWSPSHFTWMDTNYPAGTPREGYPIEIQALWVRLLNQLAKISTAAERGSWEELALRARNSLEKFFWREELGYYADVLRAPHGQPAAAAVVDDALRSNCLFVVSLGLAEKNRARRCVDAAKRYLVIPGALRSLAPLPVSVPLPIHGPDGRLLNDPRNPYWGRYEGDEDTRRKPAYHNGTGWTWTFPVFCEALARAWDFSPESVAAAQAYLGSFDRLISEGCLGHIPENVDGDVPHVQRGCDAQAWGATEAFRVWDRLLKSIRDRQTAAPRDPSADRMPHI